MFRITIVKLPGRKQLTGADHGVSHVTTHRSPERAPAPELTPAVATVRPEAAAPG